MFCTPVSIVAVIRIEIVRNDRHGCGHVPNKAIRALGSNFRIRNTRLAPCRAALNSGLAQVNVIQWQSCIRNLCRDKAQENCCPCNRRPLQCHSTGTGPGSPACLLSTSRVQRDLHAAETAHKAETIATPCLHLPHVYEAWSPVLLSSAGGKHACSAASARGNSCSTARPGLGFREKRQAPCNSPQEWNFESMNCCRERDAG